MRFGAMALIWAVLCLNSCTTMHYRSSGLISTSFSPKPGHDNLKEIVGRKEFYLWGLVPKDHIVKIDEKLSESGLISAANISIEEYQTTEDLIYSWLSFGLYIPRTYKVRGFGIKTDDRI
ncbi:MAG: hypothetical protein ACJAT2_000833 [Bacteriovoracaceae bacterium]|jgi:hypothetical protein